MKKTFVVAISGASGSIYAKTTIQALLNLDYQVHLIISKVAKQIWQYETKESFQSFISNFSKEQQENIFWQNENDLAASIASGSFRHDGMIITPCSVKTVASCANGLSQNLIERAADVCIKERFKLVLVVRETPLSSIHLKNMLSLSQAGVIILPASPAFYHENHTFQGLIDFIVGKSLDCLGIDQQLFKRWQKP